MARSVDFGFGCPLAKRSEPRTGRDSHRESVNATILPRPQSSVACQIRPNHRVKTRFCNLALFFAEISDRRGEQSKRRLGLDVKSLLHQMTLGHSDLTE